MWVWNIGKQITLPSVLGISMILREKYSILPLVRELDSFSMGLILAILLATRDIPGQIPCFSQ